MSRTRNCLLLSVLLILLQPSAPVPAAQTSSDPQARAIAESVMEQMGGHDAWNSTRYISWMFMGRRQHHWDKWTGDIRIATPAGQDRQGNPRPATLVLMNINSREGRAWADGEEVADAEELTQMLEGGWRAWVNDSYWMFMPYKLLDPGVNLRYVGEDIMEDDREADVLEMTFENVGVTPQNRYLIYVAKDSGLVEQWSYFPNRDAVEPGFTRPWAGWQLFGNIMLATSKGGSFDWEIQVYDKLPAAVFTEPNQQR